jgi:hypothetical protein
MSESLRDLVALLGADCELSMRAELVALDEQDFSTAACAASCAEDASRAAFDFCRGYR